MPKIIYCIKYSDTLLTFVYAAHLESTLVLKILLQLGLEFKRPPLVYLPTYQLDPYVPFDPAKVKEVIDELLDLNFTGHKYNVQVAKV